MIRFLIQQGVKQCLNNQGLFPYDIERINTEKLNDQQIKKQQEEIKKLEEKYQKEINEMKNDHDSQMNAQHIRTEKQAKELEQKETKITEQQRDILVKKEMIEKT